MALLQPGRGYWAQECGCPSLRAAHGYPGPAGTFGPSPTPRRAGGHCCGFSPILLLGKCCSAMLGGNFSHLAGALWEGMGSGVPGDQRDHGARMSEQGEGWEETTPPGRAAAQLAAPIVQISFICSSAGALEEKKNPNQTNKNRNQGGKRTSHKSVAAPEDPFPWVMVTKPRVRNHLIPQCFWPLAQAIPSSRTSHTAPKMVSHRNPQESCLKVCPCHPTAWHVPCVTFTTKS